MKWLIDFFNDLGGSVIGRGFYGKAVSYRASRAWRFLLIFLFLIALVMSIHFFGLLSFQYNRVVKFLEVNNYKVEFDNGAVGNMPANLKLISYREDTLAVWQWIQQQSDADSLKKEHPSIVIFVGPKGVYTYMDNVSRFTAYPEGLTATIDSEYLKNFKRGYSWIAFVAMLILIYLISIPWAALAILIFIVPFLAVKFSKAGMKFGVMWRLGMFMVSFHFLYFVIITILDIKIPYAVLFNFPLYIFVVALLVQIDPDQLEGTGRTAGI